MTSSTVLSKYHVIKMCVEIGGCVLIIYFSPPLLLAFINYLPWIYSAWKIYSKFASTYQSAVPVIGWIYRKIRGTKKLVPNDDIEMGTLEVKNKDT